MIPERNQKYNFNNQRQNKKYNYNTYVQLQYEMNDDDDETNRVFFMFCFSMIFCNKIFLYKKKKS